MQDDLEALADRDFEKLRGKMTIADHQLVTGQARREGRQGQGESRPQQCLQEMRHNGLW
ncbi:hypothetical protein D3C80_2007090 [compost metagenome]